MMKAVVFLRSIKLSSIKYIGDIAFETPVAKTF